MRIDPFLNRDKEVARFHNAFNRTDPQFIVVYGRRRIGKSTLIRNVLNSNKGDIYFLADRTNESQQRWLFSKSASSLIPDFDKATYPDWEVLLRAFNRQIPHRITLCLDEFPYLVKSCEALPSILQKLINEQILQFNLIICGSSQQLMQGYILDKKEPLYGLADEVLKMNPISVAYIAEALECSATEAIKEYSVWGGIPRYWELRKDYSSLEEAISQLILDTNGILREEPQRLLRDDMRDTIQTETLLSIIGSGANKMSEIAARAEKNASQLTDALGRLRELGYIEREIPFGEDEKKSKRGIYHISDSLFRFLYRYVVPYRSILEMGGIATVAGIVEEDMPNYVSQCWESLCRKHISGNIINGIPYNIAGRWWGKVFPDGKSDGEMVEIDVVAESIDKKHIIIGECKWTSTANIEQIISRLKRIAPLLPFIKKSHTIHYFIFLKEPQIINSSSECTILLPEDIISRE